MKTDLTRQAEKCLWHYTNKMGVFGCFEVTIGWFGKERVDFMTYSTDNTIRCYEIKVTLADLKSSAKQTFLSDYNYCQKSEKAKCHIRNTSYCLRKYGAIFESRS
ncbi:hypothetical protein EB62_00956 [Enterococcus faecalis]|nr:hypothetical protein EB62_00956 [Enterococcus faecalis]